MNSKAVISSVVSSAILSELTQNLIVCPIETGILMSPEAEDPYGTVVSTTRLPLN